MATAKAATAQYEFFFNGGLEQADPEIFGAIRNELGRQRHEIELIASENIVSRAVLEAQGSIMTNKYAEGYPGKRYYGGCQFVDVAEELAIERAKQLFGCKFANVQPNSGSQMNQAVFLALLQPGDTFMGLDLNSGGHLTHGSPVNMSGKWFNVVSYGVRKDDHLLDMDEIERLAHQHKPKLILAGGTAYSRIWDWKRFREIADSIGAWLMVDMAHIAGLVAGGVHPSPLPHAHVVTTTTHKSLRGPRGGMILCNDEDIAKKMNSAVFPGPPGRPADARHRRQGGRLRRGAEARVQDLRGERRRQRQDARRLAQGHRLDIVSGGTDNHLMLVDLRPKNATGKRAEAALGRANITCNKNGIPFDPEKPFVTSGVRLGTPAGTTRGFGEAEFREIGQLIAEVLDGLKAANSDEGNAAVEAAVKAKVVALTDRFPLYPYMG
jgi:glycine hydroxymethyltransferase